MPGIKTGMEGSLITEMMTGIDHTGAMTIIIIGTTGIMDIMGETIIIMAIMGVAIIIMAIMGVAIIIMAIMGVAIIIIMAIMGVAIIIMSMAIIIIGTTEVMAITSR